MKTAETRQLLNAFTPTELHDLRNACATFERLMPDYYKDCAMLLVKAEATSLLYKMGKS